MMNIFNCKCGSFDISQYPIIKAKIHPVKSSADDIKNYLGILLRILNRTSGQFTLYIDATESPWIESEERETTYVGMKYIQQEFKERYMAQYILIDSFITRVLISLIRGFSKKGVPQKIFSNEEKAIKEIKKTKGIRFDIKLKPTEII